MVEADPEDRYFDWDVADKKFKKDFTTRMGSLTAIGRVPDGVSVMSYGPAVALPPGTEFLFHIVRCHLSSSLEHASDYLSLVAVPDKREFNISDDFHFDGYVRIRGLSITPDGPIAASELAERLIIYPRDWGRSVDSSTVSLFVPAGWITHVLQDRNSFSKEAPELLPVPTWAAEFDYVR